MRLADPAPTDTAQAAVSATTRPVHPYGVMRRQAWCETLPCNATEVRGVIDVRAWTRRVFDRRLPGKQVPRRNRPCACRLGRGRDDPAHGHRVRREGRGRHRRRLRALPTSIRTCAKDSRTSGSSHLAFSAKRIWRPPLRSSSRTLQPRCLSGRMFGPVRSRRRCEPRGASSSTSAVSRTRSCRPHATTHWQTGKRRRIRNATHAQRTGTRRNGREGRRRRWSRWARSSPPATKCLRKPTRAPAKSRRRRPPAPAPAAAPDYATELEHLAKLRDQGVISAEDFEAKKKQILGI